MQKGQNKYQCKSNVLEEVLEIILQDQVSENVHSKAGVFKYIIMKIPLKASVT